MHYHDIANDYHGTILKYKINSMGIDFHWDIGSFIIWFSEEPSWLILIEINQNVWDITQKYIQIMALQNIITSIFSMTQSFGNDMQANAVITMLQYKMMLHTALQLLKQNIHQSWYSQKTSHG